MAKWVKFFILAVIIQAFIVYVYIHEMFVNKYPQNNIKNILPKDDETQLVDLRDFRYVIKKETICAKSDILLLVIVSSAPENTAERKAIRETWGTDDKEIKVIFAVGKHNVTVDRNIEVEDSNFHDIIQGNFIDAYKNITYKSTMALKYAVYNCPRAKFILRCDDDTFVNMPLLKNFLKNHLIPLKPKKAIFCNVNYNMVPIRDPRGMFQKWYVSFEEWPEEVYPTYCSGWYSIMTPDVALDLYKKAQKSQFFWIEDVFLTGIAAKEVEGLKHVDLSSYTLAEMDYNMSLNDTLKNRPFLFGIPNMSPEKIRVFWQHVLVHPLHESLLNFTIKGF